MFSKQRKEILKIFRQYSIQSSTNQFEILYNFKIYIYTLQKLAYKVENLKREKNERN